MIEHDDRRCSTALAEVSTSKGDRDLPPRFRRFFKGFAAFDTRPTARICQTLPGAFCQSTPLAGELRGNCLAFLWANTVVRAVLLTGLIALALTGPSDQSGASAQTATMHTQAKLP